MVGGRDKIAPLADVRKLFEAAAPRSQLIIVPEATHETSPYYFSDLLPPVLAWLSPNAPSAR